jgi:hypothetical protein
MRFKKCTCARIFTEKEMSKLLIAAFAFVLSPLAAFCAPLPVDLPPMNHADAQLVIVDAGGNENVYSPRELETYPTYRVTTTTPWRDKPAEFEGVLLSDFLAAHGLAGVDAILVTAENDYTATIPREVWEQADVLIATRVNGQPHSRRSRGPIQFVIAMEEFKGSAVAIEDHLVWMAARIETAQ